MFTGIVEDLGSVTAVTESAAGRRIEVSGSGMGELPVGASLSVNGVCLTVVATEEDSAAFDVIPETMARTNLGELVAGARVNLERPMAAQGRFDGHIVQGHIDGIGVISSIGHGDDGSTMMTIDTQARLLRHVVEKGSVAVDGVSLTVTSVDEQGFSVALIPHTLQVTTLGLREPGNTVNLETDVIAKYVERLVSR